MATFYGSWVTVSGANMYRAVVETSQTSGNTQSTVTMTVKIQYGTSSAVSRWAQYLTTSITVSSNLNGTTQSATATASPTPGGTQTLVTRSVTVNKTHAAQSVTTSAVVGTASGSGRPATSSTASGSASVGAKTSYKVTYNANGGDTSSLPAAQTKWYGETLTLSGTLPKRSGCTFFGWNTKADGTGTHYNSSASYTANAALTLYAMWLGVDLPSYTVLRTDAQGQEADEGTYGTLQASWTAVGTLAASVSVTAQNVTAGSAITLSGNTSGTVTPGQDANGSVSSTFGGTFDTDTRYLVRIYIEASTTSPYAGQTRTVSRYFEAYVDVAYITIDVLAGGHGVSFGSPASQEGFHCHMPAEFHDGLAASNIGTLVEKDISGYSAVNVANSTWNPIGHIELTAGKWLVCYNAIFASNATGRRYIVLSTSSGSSGSGVEQRMGEQITNAVSGGSTALGHSCVVVVSNGSATFYVNVWQNSGGLLSTTGYIRAIQIQ